MGVVTAAAERTEDARAAFQRALAIDPEDAVAHHGLAGLALESGRFGSSATGLAKAANGFAAALRANTCVGASRNNVDIVLYVFLGTSVFWVFAVASVASRERSYTDAGLARLLSALLLVFPVFFVARFVSALTPQLRGYLWQAVRNPVIASAILCDVIAAIGLVVGAACPRASSTAFACAVAFSNSPAWSCITRFNRESSLEPGPSPSITCGGSRQRS